MESDREKRARFRAAWANHYNVPRDWGHAAVTRGDSSWIEWGKWITGDRISVDLVIECMESFRNDKQVGPKLGQVRDLYMKRAGRGRSAGAPMPLCEICLGSGVLIVAMARVKGANGKRVSVVVKPHIPVATDYLWENGVPCRCSAGQRVNAAYGEGQKYKPDALAKLFKCRVNTSDFLALSRQCAELAGVPLAPIQQLTHADDIWIRDTIMRISGANRGADMEDRTETYGARPDPVPTAAEVMDEAPF